MTIVDRQSPGLKARSVREQFFSSLEELCDEIAEKVGQDELLAAIDEAACEAREEKLARVGDGHFRPE